MKIALTGGIACGKSMFAKFLAELGVSLLDADDVVHELEAPGGAAVEAILHRFPTVAAQPQAANSQPSTTNHQSPITKSIDRKKLAEIVFSDQMARHDLEAILFPMVRERLSAFAANQPISRPTNQPISRPTNQPISRPINQPINQSTDQPINQLTDQPINQLTDQPINQLTNKPINQIKISIIPLLFESHWDRDYDIILAIASSEEEQMKRMLRSRGYTQEHAKARLAAQMPIAEKIRRADYVIANDSTPEHLRDEACRLLAWLKERRKYEH